MGMLMISERKLINLLNIFNTELPKFFSPYQASEHMEWDYDKKKATIKYMERSGFLDKKPGENLYNLTNKALKYLIDKKNELKVMEMDIKITQFLKQNPGSDKTKLAKHLKTSPKTAYGLLRDMEKRGLVVVEKDGRKNIYRLPEPSIKPEPENQHVEVHEPKEVLNECQYIGVIQKQPLTLGKIIDNFWQNITHAECKKNDPTPDHLTLSFKDQKSVIESYNDLPENIKNTTTLKMDPYRKTYTMDLDISS
jgi:DNA-binding PadR family transcriptional regulator